MTYREKCKEINDKKINPEDNCVRDIIPNAPYPEWCGEDCDGEGCSKCWDREIEN